MNAWLQKESKNKATLFYEELYGKRLLKKDEGKCRMTIQRKYLQSASLPFVSQPAILHIILSTREKMEQLNDTH